MAESPLHRRISPAETLEDAAMAATIIAQAFSSLPVCQWLVPDETTRVRTLAAVFDIQVQHALNWGTLDLLTQVDPTTGAGAGVGVAVWFDHTRYVPLPPDYDDRLREAAGPRYEAFSIVDRKLLKRHPRLSHHYLAFLAVEPTAHGSGIGTALLEHHHALLDRHRIPAYLEASSPGSRRLYQRHAYTPHGPTVRVHTDAKFSPMWRGPQWSDV